MTKKKAKEQYTVVLAARWQWQGRDYRSYNDVQKPPRKGDIGVINDDEMGDKDAFVYWERLDQSFWTDRAVLKPYKGPSEAEIQTAIRSIMGEA